MWWCSIRFSKIILNSKCDCGDDECCFVSMYAKRYMETKQLGIELVEYLFLLWVWYGYVGFSYSFILPHFECILNNNGGICNCKYIFLYIVYNILNSGNNNKNFVLI